jgi:hypothetical protein
VRPEAYARLLANVEGLAALLAREHHSGAAASLGGGGAEPLSPPPPPPPLLSFEDDHSLRCTFPLEGEQALLGVGARSDVIIEDMGAALRAADAAALMAPSSSLLPSPGFFSSSPSLPPTCFRRLIEIKCPAGGTATSSSPSTPPASCANIWWNQALLYAALSKRPVHAVSVADVAQGVLYSAPVSLSPRDRTQALKRVLRAFRFHEGAQEMLAGLLRARIEAGRIEDEEEGGGGEEEAGGRGRRRKGQKSSGLPPRFVGVAPGGGWALEEGLGDSEALEESRRRRTTGRRKSGAEEATTAAPRRARNKASAAAG